MYIGFFINIGEDIVLVSFLGEHISKSDLFDTTLLMTFMEKYVHDYWALQHLY